MSAEQERKRFEQDALRRHFGVKVGDPKIGDLQPMPQGTPFDYQVPPGGRDTLQSLLRLRAQQMRKEADRLDKLADETQHLSPDAEHALWEMAIRP
jgi:hypothetical protein